MSDVENGQGIPSDTIEQVLQLQNIMIAHATGANNPDDKASYVLLRKMLMQDQDVSPRLPQDVRVCRSLDHFWGIIKSKYSTYQERRVYLWEEFSPLLDYLESQSTNPVDDLVGDALASFSTEGVQRVWERALDRRENDPEAAITSARSLIETVCKHILDEFGEQYNNRDELSRLYRKTAELMKLAPDQQSEQSFR